MDVSMAVGFGASGAPSPVVGALSSRESWSREGGTGWEATSAAMMIKSSLNLISCRSYELRFAIVEPFRTMKY